jgi:hypothetical protein
MILGIDFEDPPESPRHYDASTTSSTSSEWMGATYEHHDIDSLEYFCGYWAVDSPDKPRQLTGKGRAREGGLRETFGVAWIDR